MGKKTKKNVIKEDNNIMENEEKNIDEIKEVEDLENIEEESVEEVEETVEEVEETVEEVEEPNEFVEEINEEVTETIEEVKEQSENIEPVIEDSIENNEIIGKIINFPKIYVRKEPNKDSEPVGTVSEEDDLSIDLEHSTDDFYKIFASNGLEGYCVKELVKIE